MKKISSNVKNFRSSGRPSAPVRHPAQNGRHGLPHLQTSVLREQIHRYHTKLALISKAQPTLAEAQTRPELYDRLARLVFAVLPKIHWFYLFRVNPENGLIYCVYAAQEHNLQPQPFDPAAYISPAGSDPIRQAVLRRSPLVLQAPTRQAQSIVIAPMIHQNRVEGVLEVVSKIRLRFGTLEMDIMALLGNSAALALENLSLRSELVQTNQQLNFAYDAAVEGWRRALELRDRATENHGSRVAEMTVRLAVTLGYSPLELSHLRFGAQLHDIGKIGVPDSVLLKPGPLDADDLKIMREHPGYAYEMLHSIPNFQPILDIPYSHHERWDGTGYPRGLRGEQIPYPARIFAVIDVWDALRSDRPYRSAWPETQVIRHIRDESGKHFDPCVVEAFLRMMLV